VAWVARLVDVAPDGSGRLITQGWLRASFRYVDPARSRPGAPYLPDDRDTPVTIGETTEYRLDLWDTAYTLGPGHRLRLWLGSADTPSHEPLVVAGRNLIFHDATYPSQLLLGVGGDAASASPCSAAAPVAESRCRVTTAVIRVGPAARTRRVAHDLEARCDRLRSLHTPGAPLVLPNAWDAATARAVVDGGFPAVATTSAGIASALGHADHEGAPADEMFAAAARIAHAVDVPVTVDAEAGYGLAPAVLVAALSEAGAAGCNLEDSDHAIGELRDIGAHADWLRAVRAAADAAGYGPVINTRIDVFLPSLHAGAPEGTQARLVPEALERATAYVDAGADCVFPIGLWERDTLAAFIAGSPAPVNVLGIPRAPSTAELAELGAARISYGGLLQRAAIERFSESLADLAPAG